MSSLNGVKIEKSWEFDWCMSLTGSVLALFSVIKNSVVFWRLKQLILVQKEIPEGAMFSSSFENRIFGIVFDHVQNNL